MPVLPRVLLADADTTLARTLAWMLKQNGYDVTTAHTLDAVEAHLDLEHVDLLLLDLALFEGRELVLGALRATVRPAPAVLCTAVRAPDAAAARTLQVDPAAVIIKPFQVRDLLERMRQALRARRASAEIEEPLIQREIVEIFSDIVGVANFDDFCRVLVRGVARALNVPRCSVVLAERGTAIGHVIAASDNPTLHDLPVEIDRYPEIRRALEAEGPVLIPDVATDPMFDAVRALWERSRQPVETLSAIAMRFRLGPTGTGVFFIRTSDVAAPLSAADARFAERVLATAVSALEDAAVRDAVGQRERTPAA